MIHLVFDLLYGLSVLWVALPLLISDLVFFRDDVKVVEHQVFHLHLHLYEVLRTGFQGRLVRFIVLLSQVVDATLQKLLLHHLLADSLVGVKQSKHVDHEISGNEVIFRVLLSLNGLLIQLINQFLLKLSHAVLSSGASRSPRVLFVEEIEAG